MSDELLDDGGPPLPPHLRAALFVEGLDGDPADDARVRMAARLAGALGIAAAVLLPVGLGGGGVVGGAAAAAGAGAGAGAAGAAGAAAGGALGAKAVGLALGALVVGGAVGVTVSELRPRHAETVTTPAPRAPGDASNTGAIDAPPIDAPDIDAPDVDAAPADAPAASKRDASAVDAPMVDAMTATADSIARERELIDVARSAIRAKDLRLATKQLVEHELRFPSGALAEERQVLVIEVALTKGDYDTTTKRAAEFLAAHPSSVFRRRVEDMLQAAADRR